MRVRAGLLAVAAAVIGALTVPTADAPAWSRGPDRIAGSNRVATAVAVAQRTFPLGAETVVVASATSFPDGLVAGPLAVLLGGPVLLTDGAVLSPAAAGEIQRLLPSRLVVVGGTSAIGDGVLAELAALTGVVPARLSGPDRYATAATVASWFPSPTPTVFVATGASFPDALAAAAAAAAATAPVLLATADEVPTATAAALDRLAPSEVIVVGGEAALGPAVVAGLSAGGRNLQRVTGADRYATAVELAALRFPAPSQVILVTGESYPDALSAVPLAASFDAPVLLVRPGCAPGAVASYLSARGWPDLTIVGGAGVVGAAAAAVVPCDPVPLGVVADGITVQRYELPGPVVAHAVVIDRGVGYNLRAATGTGQLQGRSLVTHLARSAGAPVVVNGDFFTSSGTPVHLSAVNGRLMKSPGLIESVVAWDRSTTRTPVIGTPQPVVTLFAGSAALPIARVNDGGPGPGEVVMFTTEGPDTVSFAEPVCATTLSNPSATSVSDVATYQWFTTGSSSCGATSVKVAEDTVVTPVAAGSALAPLSEGTPVSVGWRAAEGWGPVSDVIGVNLPLVRAGVVAREIEVGTVPFFRERAPRTAIGWTADGRILLVVVDGRQPGYSVGMTPFALSQFMLSVGAVDAANLDGGGSTTLSVRGLLVNRPSDSAGERPVGSALVVLPTGAP